MKDYPGKDCSVSSFDDSRSSSRHVLSPEATNQKIKGDVHATGSNFHNLNVVLDNQSVDCTRGNGFSRAIANMARGTSRQRRKEYSPFRENVFTQALTNSAINCAPISRESDYHVLETRRHWEKSSGSRAVFQSGTHSLSRTFPSINSLMGSRTAILPLTNDKYLEDGQRPRRSKSLLRTKTHMFQEADHNSEILSKHVG